jgi:dTDP-glucose pyrophosphorylase
MAKTLKTSPRVELEIIGLNREYLKLGKLQVQKMNRDIAWLDAGSFKPFFGHLISFKRSGSVKVLRPDVMKKLYIARVLLMRYS